MMAYGAGCA